MEVLKGFTKVMWGTALRLGVASTAQEGAALITHGKGPRLPAPVPTGPSLNPPTEHCPSPVQYKGPAPPSPPPAIQPEALSPISEQLGPCQGGSTRERILGGGGGTLSQGIFPGPWEQMGFK